MGSPGRRVIFAVTARYFSINVMATRYAEIPKTPAVELIVCATPQSDGRISGLMSSDLGFDALIKGPPICLLDMMAYSLALRSATLATQSLRDKTLPYIEGNKEEIKPKPTFAGALARTR